MSSVADSEDLGQFLERNNEDTQQESLQLPKNRGPRARRLVFTRTHTGENDQAPELPAPARGAPLRIRTRRPINLRPDSSIALNDRARPGFFSQTPGEQRVEGIRRPQLDGIRIFTRDEVRELKVPKAASVKSGDGSSVKNDRSNMSSMEFRLQQFLGDNVSVASGPRAYPESDRFTLGSYHSSARGSLRASIARSRARSLQRSEIDDGTTTGLRRALDSHFVRPKRVKRDNEKKVPTKLTSESSFNLASENGKPPRQVLMDLDKGSDINEGNELELSSRPNEGIDDDYPIDGAPAAAAAGSAAGSAAASSASPASSSVVSVDLLAPPSRLSSDSLQNEPAERGDHDTNEQLFVNNNASQQSETGAANHRPREPHEIEPPLIFEIPVTEMPNIDWGADDIDVDGEYLQQQLEHSESESEEESDAGSVADMIDDASDDGEVSYEEDNNKEWTPPHDLSTRHAADISSSSSDDDDEGGNRVEALTDSEGEMDENVALDADVALPVVEARRLRPKRSRIPTVKWWLGERIEYETDPKFDIMTAVEVRRVEPAKKTYRRRRTYRRRQTVQQIPEHQALSQDDAEADAPQQDVHVPIFDTKSQQWRNRTVARSINGLTFEPVVADDGMPMPLISRCVLFGGKKDSAPMRLYVLRIEAGGLYSLTAEQNRASTFVVWRGKCTVHLNNHEFDLSKGMACLVPRGNDFFVDNGGYDRLSTGDVYLFVTEVNADANPELADALTRDAHSMVSGAAAFSNFFEGADNSSNPEVDEEAAADNWNADGAENYQGDEAGEPSDNVNDYDGTVERDGDAGLQFENSTSLGSFSRALKSQSEISGPPNRIGVAAAATGRPRVFTERVVPPDNDDSLSIALKSDYSRKIRADANTIRDRATAASEQTQPRKNFDEDSAEADDEDLLSAYLDGRENAELPSLREGPELDPEELRVRAFIDSWERRSH